MTNPNPEKGAPGSAEPTPEPAPVTPMLVEGRKVVFESNLIAAKESLTKQLNEQQTVHSDAIDKVRTDLSEAQTAVAQANAKLQETEQARLTGGTSEEEVSRIKQEAEMAKTAVETVNAKVLDLRRANIVLASAGVVTQEQLNGKTLEQLDSFEEALKALSQSRGIGNYAVGPGGAGTGPVSNMERAAALLAATPFRGVSKRAENE